MKLSLAATTTAALLASSASAASLFQLNAGQSPFVGGGTGSTTLANSPVPGSNPLSYCGDTSNDILTIKDVTIEPNPPLPGQTLYIKARGTLTERVSAGAYVHVEVKYGYIKLLNQNIDLCENADQVGLSCPVEPGELVLHKEVELPKAIPPGKYHVVADVYNDDDTPITCITADVFFKPGNQA